MQTRRDISPGTAAGLAIAIALASGLAIILTLLLLSIRTVRRRREQERAAAKIVDEERAQRRLGPEMLRGSSRTELLFHEIYEADVIYGPPPAYEADRAPAHEISNAEMTH